MSRPMNLSSRWWWWNEEGSGVQRTKMVLLSLSWDVEGLLLLLMLMMMSEPPASLRAGSQQSQQ